MFRNPAHRAALLAVVLGGLITAGPAGAATTTLAMTVDPATATSATTVSLESNVSGSPQPALQVLTIAMPRGFTYHGHEGTTICNPADLQGFEPRCAESSLLGTGSAVVQFKSGNVSGTAKVDPVRMYNAGPDNVLFHMKALAPISRGVVIPSTVKWSDADFGPVFQIGPATGTDIGTLALTSFKFQTKPGVLQTGSCETGTWLAAGRYLFLGGATQEINPRITCGQPGGPSGPSTGTASAPAPAAALSVAGTPVGSSGKTSLGAAKVKVVSTRLTAKGGKVAVRLKCTSKARCLGTLRLHNKRPPGGVARYGTARFSIKGGTSKTISVKLKAKAKTAVARGKVVTWARAHLDGRPRTADSVKKLSLKR
ncbi:MAG: hypothetical protein JHC95_18090 [Solirubrobacteraceae bacterium]|nr:hypothetical protein [Solirubrobacteraceae bacterium]